MTPTSHSLLAKCHSPLNRSARMVTAFGIWASVFIQPLLAVEDARPAAHWGFGQEESTRLESHGGVHRDVPGPRPEKYPDFAQDNTAVRLDGKGARFTFADSEANSPFVFNNKDEITLEAWVKIDEINEGENAYVIGKGRTGDPRFSADNQNWALRIRKLQGRIHTSFLFSSVRQTPKASANDESNWHRWTSDQGFQAGQAWHHIAIAYRFGDPDSILAVIDGNQVTGSWDVGGPTRNAPTVDTDAIWIGSALGGSPSNSFRGDLDEIAIYRQRLPLATLKARYRGPELPLTVRPLAEVMPELGTLQDGAVQLSFHEGMPAHFRWLNEGEAFPEATLKWETNAFLLDRLPQRYDAWGIRESWKAPVLVRMAADVALPAGKQRFLMRVRGLSRLWVNGDLVARSGPMTGSQDGFEPMTPPARPPHPGLRIAEHRQQEVFGECKIADGKKSRVVLETLVGGKDFRSDPGETCVAIETADGTSYLLLQPDSETEHPLTDSTVKSLLAQQSVEMQKFDDQCRRSAALSQESFWKMRHDFARNWAQQHPAPTIPGEPGNRHPIDAFLDAKIQSALTAAAQTPLADAQHFHKNVLPILREHCFRCHGEKSQGGLRLNSLEAARSGGDSGLAAIHPGAADKSEIMHRIRSTSAEDRMPPGGTGLTSEQISTLNDWINSGANWPAPPVTPNVVTSPPLVADATFLRRVFLDTVGVIPLDKDVREFLRDESPDKRTRMIDRLLADDRCADHWTSYWLDVLAENPTLINASLNTTGPFRWFIYESFRDQKPIDRFVTELILLRGSAHEGGSAGFGIAANNDAPFAAKGQIISSAFLAVQLQCARCHDSPYHSTKQSDLYALAAMFEKKPVTVPDGSRVPAAFFEKQQRVSLIQVTLKPGEPVLPVWPFAEVTGSADDDAIRQLMQNPDDPREKLAALITAPGNQRFAEVNVNRVWRRLIGAGILESPDDWEGKAASHPDLLKWLAHEFITHDYEIRHVARLILTSQLYQREATRQSLPVSPELQFFVAPLCRRMSAEQVVDSLHMAVGKPMDVEEMTFAPEAGKPSMYRLTLGVPDRAWKFSSLGNERDRPSLSLPNARAVADIMEAFGWNGARQSPRTDRELDPNVLQPGVLQNSDAAVLLSRASVHSGLAEAAVDAATPNELVETIFLRILGRVPGEGEQAALAPLLADGFQDRLLPAAEWQETQPLEHLPVVTWSNHVQSEANTVAVEMERRARLGPPPDPRLRPQWRETYEDVVWSVMNLSEFVWIP
ncbi:DUF1553 domain-containing protein [Planctomicrobium piriforme]|uniref:Concanavalin A-like lectin/glucanases superfamily protein n=1 Tax=Planctomicrobium piriforme TaxID=1576369 RepID=A0A1I3MZF0_9PLAN|nr:DUF1553 domain-containing protein [Planctomicrobium piriforme]SFJ02383.1 Concanavalin A-like lectin/glucanases superfamily protein [Planctomicrobium piriforme]